MIKAERHFLLKTSAHFLSIGVILTLLAACAPAQESERNQTPVNTAQIPTTVDQDEPVRTIDIEEVVITAKKKSKKTNTAPQAQEDNQVADEIPTPEMPKTQKKAKAQKDSGTQVSADVNSEQKKQTEAAPATLQETPVSKTEEKKTPAAKTPVVKKEKAEASSAPISNQRKKEISFIRTAYDVVMKESKKLGTACNRFIMRVLELSGFNKEGFVANDFDVYAKRHLKNHKSVTFNDSKELERHLNSFPERTPFILQWERNGKHGHIALVERSNSKLYSYESSLNSFHPRVKETTVNKLINLSSRKQVIVYSDFIQ